MNLLSIHFNCLGALSVFSVPPSVVDVFSFQEPTTEEEHGESQSYNQKNLRARLSANKDFHHD